MKATHPYIIGIDPGGTTGMCIYHKAEKRIKVLTSGTMLDCIYTLDLYYKDISRQAFFRIEDARLRKWIPKEKTESAERGRREGAGHVKAHCAIWEDYCKRNHIAYELVAPKNNKTKVTAAYFKKLTGWDKQTNNHERDAALLVVGY